MNTERERREEKLTEEQEEEEETQMTKKRPNRRREKRICEGMEFRCHQTGPGKGFNENWGNLPSRQWDPLFSEVRNTNSRVS